MGASWQNKQPANAEVSYRATGVRRATSRPTYYDEATTGAGVAAVAALARFAYDNYGGVYLSMASKLDTVASTERSGSEPQVAEFIASHVPGNLPMPDLSPGSSPWSETSLARSSEKRLMVFAGSSNVELSRGIAQRLGIRLGELTRKRFANGETYVKYEESVRGADIFLVQTPCGDSVNDDLIELLLMVSAAKLASVHRVTAVMPWFCYSRQDKKVASREPITGRLVASLLQAAGVDRVLSMDLHAGQMQGFFNIPVDHMTAVPILSTYFRDLGLFGDQCVVVSPDAGGAKRAKKFAERLDSPLAILTKERPGHNIAEVTSVIGEVAGRTAIVIDDIIDTAGTLCAGAEALLAEGAREVYACATHGVFSPPALDRLDASAIREVVVTDTIAHDVRERPDKVRVLSVAGVLADTIRNVFCDESVSAIFAGENQLF